MQHVMKVGKEAEVLGEETEGPRSHRPGQPANTQQAQRSFITSEN